MTTATSEQAIENMEENMEYVRRLLAQKQPGFAEALELAAARRRR
jgi:hypothetical protein